MSSWAYHRWRLCSAPTRQKLLLHHVPTISLESGCPAEVGTPTQTLAGAVKPLAAPLQRFGHSSTCRTIASLQGDHHPLETIASP